MKRAPSVSIILATYNWPEALELCLQSLSRQTSLDFEVVIADDGSAAPTKSVIEAWTASALFPIHHEWQEDNGFRKSKILNKAIERAQGEYLIFLDGDCIAQQDFIFQHRKLAQEGAMVTGSRILLGKRLTELLCHRGTLPNKLGHVKALLYRVTGQINKWMPLLIKLPDHSGRTYSKFVWSRIKGCNMAAWRTDVKLIGGFDESLEGWGHEDADFVFRLQNAGVIRKSGGWATEVLHLWHKTASKESAAKNAEIVRSKILAKSLK